MRPPRRLLPPGPRDPSPGATWIPRGQSGNPMERRAALGSLTARAGLRQAEKPGRTGFSPGMAAWEPGRTKRRPGENEADPWKQRKGRRRRTRRAGRRDGAGRPSERRKQGEGTGESRGRGAAKGRRAAAKGEGRKRRQRFPLPASLSRERLLLTNSPPPSCPPLALPLPGRRFSPRAPFCSASSFISPAWGETHDGLLPASSTHGS
jgi:hypothetical protein